jgi:hypothetical protein
MSPLPDEEPSFGERGSGLEAAAAQGFDEAEELACVVAALGR